MSYGLLSERWLEPRKEEPERASLSLRQSRQGSTERSETHAHFGCTFSRFDSHGLGVNDHPLHVAAIGSAGHFPAGFDPHSKIS